MTNEDIIFAKRIELMNQGVLEGSGEILISDDGTEIEIPKEIHTYQGWKALGRQVKKGEHSIASFEIWKHIDCKKKSEEEEKKEVLFLTKAFFFTENQTEHIE